MDCGVWHVSCFYRKTGNDNASNPSPQNKENIMTGNTIQAIREQAISTASREEQGIKKTEVLFGVIMAITALSGIWGAVSLLISWFMAN